jgi:NAD(P)-dependent dehydrogenase (short-subunit alcohol dehydrogenase family)
MKLENKVAIVTGGGSGMGRATSLLFAKEGAKVVVADIVEESAKKTASDIQAAGGKATPLRVDVSQSADWQKLVRLAVDTYSKLDILINNAGIFDSFAKCLDISDELWDKVLAVNLKGYFMGCKAALPELIKTKGNIVMTASVAGLGADGGGAAYTASKFGVVGLTHQIACEYARDGVRVNCVCPGGIITGLTKDFVESEHAKNLMAERTPLGRWGEAEEVARAILFLASDDASFITGTPFRVDGGFRSK